MNKSYRLSNLFFFLIGLLALNISGAQSNFWEQTSGPFGGSITAMALTPNNELFVGTDGGGVFRSTDDGQNWIDFNFDLGDRRVLSIASDSNGNIFCGTVGRGGLYILRNGNTHWEIPQFFPPNNQGLSILIHPNKSIFIGTGGIPIIIRSTDQGNTWTNLNPNFPGAGGNPLNIAINKNGDIFACTDNGIYKSSDNGDHWIKLDPAFRTCSMVVDSKGQLFAGTWGAGIWKSSDNGATWSQLNAFIGGLDIYTVILKNDDNIFIGSDVGIYRSTNRGTSWDKVNNGLSNNQALCILMSQQGNAIYCGTKSGFYCSTNNGDNWIQRNKGLSAAIITDITIGPNNLLLAGTERNGIYFSFDHGDNWIQTNLSQALRVNALLMKSNLHIFVATDSGLYDSKDFGNSWSLLKYQGTNISAMALDKSENIYVTDGDKISYSTNEGSVWIERATPTYTIISLSIDSADNIFFGTNFHGIYKSLDKGVSWKYIGNSLANIIAIAFSKKGNIFSVNGSGGGPYGGIYRYLGSSSWGLISMIDPVDGTDILVNSIGTIFTSVKEKGVFFSTDECATWIAINSGLTNLEIFSLAIDSNSILYAGTSNGVYRSLKPTITSVYNPERTIRNKFDIKNYPNPFSSSTSIQFQLQKPTYITLKIFNALGVEIQTLINNEEYYAGSHSVEFTLRTSHLELQTGIYFYQLITPEFTQTKKMVVIR